MPSFHALIKRGVAAALTAAALTFGGGAVAQAESVLKVAIENDLKIVDPFFTTAEITRQHALLVYDQLFALDADGKMRPQMVDTYSVSPDSLVWTFNLRDGLVFHDGAPVRAADAVASIKRWMKRHSLGALMADFVNEVVATGEKSFEIRLNRPFGLVLDALGTPTNQAAVVMPERLANTDPFEQIKESIGSGPYKMVKEEWVPGKQIVYVRNEAYKPRAEAPSGLAGGKLAKVDRIELINIPDKTTAQAALAAGEIDVLEFPPVDLVPLLERDPNIKVSVYDKLGYLGMIRFNHLHPPFNDVKARLAFMWGLDQARYLKTIIGDPRFYQVCGSPFICGTRFASKAGAEILETSDMEKAKKLLAESSYDGREVVVLDTANHARNHAAAVMTVETLRKIGFKVRAESIDTASLFQRRAKKEAPEQGGWNVFITGSSSPGQAEPAINYAINASCKGDNWPGWPCNEEIEALRREFVGAIGFDAQKAVAERLQAKVLEYGTYAFWGMFLRPYAHRANVTGILDSPTPVFWNISKQ